MIILRLLLLLTNLHLKLLSTQGTGADKLLSTQRVNFPEQKKQQIWGSKHGGDKRLVIPPRIYALDGIHINPQIFKVGVHR